MTDDDYIDVADITKDKKKAVWADRKEKLKKLFTSSKTPEEKAAAKQARSEKAAMYSAKVKAQFAQAQANFEQNQANNPNRSIFNGGPRPPRPQARSYSYSETSSLRASQAFQPMRAPTYRSKVTASPRSAFVDYSGSYAKKKKVVKKKKKKKPARRPKKVEYY